MNGNAIFISIKPKFTKKIEAGEKNYEFRKYYPKEPINQLYVYESSPTCSLKYIIDIGDVIKYPDKIKKAGYGNSDFNKGSKESKYAYEIKRLYKLEKSIPLDILKSKFDFAPPQSYAYASNYLELTEYISKVKKEMIFEL